MTSCRLASKPLGLVARAEGFPATRKSSCASDGKDSEARQRKAIDGYANAAGIVIVDWFYDGRTAPVLNEHSRLASQLRHITRRPTTLSIASIHLFVPIKTMLSLA